MSTLDPRIPKKKPKKAVGRPPLEGRVVRILTMSAAQLNKFKQLGGSGWLRKQIEMAKTPSERAQMIEAGLKARMKRKTIPAPEKRTTSVVLIESSLAKLRALGGPGWVRDQIDKAELEHPGHIDLNYPSDDKLPPNSKLSSENFPVVKIPLVDSPVHAGFPSPAESYVRDSLDLNELLVTVPAATYFIEAAGDSMDLAGIEEGDLLVVDRSCIPHHNDIVIMDVNGEFTVKRLYKKNKEIKLVPESSNPSYKTIVPRENDEWHFVGKVTFVIKRC